MKTRAAFIIGVFILASSCLWGQGAEWDFQYVSSLMERPSTSRIWFSANEDGSGPELEGDVVDASQGSYVMYLHSETWGASGMTMTFTPFRNGTKTIGCGIGVSGSDSASLSVVDEDRILTSLPWDDEELIASRRVWRLEIVPDREDLQSAVAGSWTMSVEVRVDGI